MGLFNSLKNDWDRMNKQLNRILPYEPSPTLTLIIGIIILVGFAIISSKFPIVTFTIWIGIPILLGLIKLMNYSLPRTIKISIVILILSISGGIYFNKEEIRDFIGYNGIKGYHSHYELLPVTHNSGTDAEYTEEEEVQIYDCDHWIGNLILGFFNWMFVPFLLIIPYSTWKLLNE